MKQSQKQSPPTKKTTHTSKTYSYRFFVPLTTFLASSLLAANGELKMGWLLGHLIGYATNSIFLFYSLVSGDPLLANLFVFGLVTGFGTIMSDCYQVKRDILIYPQEGPFWGCSPEYMFWCSCPYMVQFGAVAYYLLVKRKWSLPAACVFTGLLGAALIGSIEFQANAAQGWSYAKVPMLYKHLPLYIVLLQIPNCGLVPVHVSLMMRYVDEKKNIQVKDLVKSIGLGIVQAFVFPTSTILSLEGVNLISKLLH